MSDSDPRCTGKPPLPDNVWYDEMWDLNQGCMTNVTKVILDGRPAQFSGIIHPDTAIALVKTARHKLSEVNNA